MKSDWLISTSWDVGKTYHILVGNFDAHRFSPFTLQKMLFNHDAPARVRHKRPRGFLMNVRNAILRLHALSHKCNIATHRITISPFTGVKGNGTAVYYKCTSTVSKRNGRVSDRLVTGVMRRSSNLMLEGHCFDASQL